MNIAPRASVIVVSFNTRDILRNCLSRLDLDRKTCPIEVIVIDNASRDGSADMVEKEFPFVQLIRSTENLGFAAANNRAFRQAQGEYLVLLNPDATPGVSVLGDAITKMDTNPKVGIAGGRLIGANGQDEPSARMFPSLLNDFLALSGLASRFPQSRLFGRFDRTWAPRNQAAEVDWVPGAFAIVRREVIDTVGSFDERFFLYYEEVDLCRRIKAAGWKVQYWPDLMIRHIGGVSSKTLDHEISQSGSQLILWRLRSALLYYRKHHGVWIAWMAARIEWFWHAARRQRALHLSSNAAKANESGRVMNLVQKAWNDTAGGKFCPVRPW